MSTERTPGLLRLGDAENDTGTIKHKVPVDADGYSLLTVVESDDVKFAAVYKDADARRMVACWNACEGISTERLEDLGRPLLQHLIGADKRAARMVTERAELLIALKNVLAVANVRIDDPRIAAFDAARAAVAKAETAALQEGS